MKETTEQLCIALFCFIGGLTETVVALALIIAGKIAGPIVFGVAAISFFILTVFFLRKYIDIKYIYRQQCNTHVDSEN